MKGCVKKVGAALLTAALSFSALTACTPSVYNLELVSKPTITVQSFDEETGLHTVLVEGLAQNNSGQSWHYVYASADFYDELGDPMDTLYGWESIEFIDVDEVWHYYMLVETEIVPTSVEIDVYASW